jgi:hypothetical protein
LRGSEQRGAASTVNLALASLDALYRCLGLGRPHVRRDKPALAAPRALDEAGQRRLLRAADVGHSEPTTGPQDPRSLAQHLRFVADRLMTQLEMTTSTLASASGSASR